MQLEDVGLFNLAEVRTGATFIDSQQRFEFLQRGAMDVERVWQEFANRRPLAGIVDRFGLAGSEEQFVGLLTRLTIVAEEGA